MFYLCPNNHECKNGNSGREIYCKVCDKIFMKSESLAYSKWHDNYYHRSSINLMCECGCGSMRDYKKRFIHGHNARIRERNSMGQLQAVGNPSVTANPARAIPVHCTNGDIKTQPIVPTPTMLVERNGTF